MFLRHLFLATSPVLLVACLIVGCGPTPKRGPGEGALVPELKALHTYEAGGSQPAGTYTAVALVGEQVLLGTEDGLDVLQYDPEAGFTKVGHEDLRASPVSACVVGKIRAGKAAGEAWVSSSEGIARFRAGKIDLREESGPARDAAAFLEGIWVARSSGIEAYQPDSSQISPMPIVLTAKDEASELVGVKKPTVLATVSAPSIAVGTEFGLLLFTRAEASATWAHKYGAWDRVSGDSVTRVEGNCALPGNQIYNLRLSPDGSQLAVCTDGGLAITDAKLESWKSYQGRHRVNRSDPLKGLYHEEVDGPIPMPSSDVYDMAFGKGVYFLATGKGLAIVPQTDPEKGTRVLDVDAGLPSSRVSGVAYDPTRGLLFVAAQFGLVVFRT